MSMELNLKEGFHRTIGKVETIKERPILISVYGWPNSGKSYFIDQLADYLEENGLSTCGCGGGPKPYSFESLRDKPWILREVFLFHCGWERDNLVFDGKLVSKKEDPNFLAESIAGRKIHLNIGIYNPDLYSKPAGGYDFVIVNPDSKRK